MQDQDTLSETLEAGVTTRATAILESRLQIKQALEAMAAAGRGGDGGAVPVMLADSGAEYCVHEVNCVLLGRGEAAAASAKTDHHDDDADEDRAVEALVRLATDPVRLQRLRRGAHATAATFTADATGKSWTGALDDLTPPTTTT